MKRSYIVALLVVLVLFIDQAFKFYIKLNFDYNQDVLIQGQEWARLHFVENEGMAFGITFDWEYGKLVLSLFRILMVAGFIWYIRLLLRLQAPLGLLCSVGLITAGALGNIFDSAFYGLIFSDSVHADGPATLVPWGEGYAEFLHGRVVDMLYFPMFEFSIPEWVPKFGGENFLFFSPIFNIADAAITCGVLSILLFQRSFFKEKPSDTPIAEGDVALEDNTEGANMAHEEMMDDFEQKDQSGSTDATTHTDSDTATDTDPVRTADESNKD